MDIIENNLAQLRIIQTNFKKAPNRRYRRASLQNKLLEIQALKKNIADSLSILENAISSETSERIISTERVLTGELLLIINQKIANLGDKPDLTLKNLGKLVIISIRLTKAAKMAALIEVIKTVTALLPVYDGTPNKLNNFVDALNVVKQVATNVGHLPTVINIVMTKLEGKARYAFPAAPASIDAVIAKLREVSTPTPLEAIIVKLANCKQRSNITAYTKERKSKS